jgi:PilZ domain
MEQRRTRRFQLQLPLSITRSGAERVTLAGFTKNISSSGVLFTAEREPDLGGPIEYVIILTREGPQSVSLRCMGKVLRSHRLGTSPDELPANFQIAATLERYEFVRGVQGRSASI